MDLLTIRLRSAGDGVLPETQLQLVDAAGAKQTQERSGGTFFFEGLAPGQVSVSAEAIGFRPLDEVLEVRPGRMEVELALVPLRLVEVLLFDEQGAPMGELSGDRGMRNITDTVWLPGQVRPHLVVTGPDIDRLPQQVSGGWSGLQTGHGERLWELPRTLERAPGHIGFLDLPGDGPSRVHLVLGGAAIGSWPIGPQINRLEIRLSAEQLAAHRASVQVRLLLPDGRPVGAQTVGFQSRQIHRGEGGRVDETGLFSAEGLLPGVYWMTIETETGSFPLSLELRAGEHLDLGTRTLDLGRRLAGRIVDADGRGVEGQVMVQLAEPLAGAAQPGRGLWVGADEQGRFELQAPVDELLLFAGGTVNGERAVPLGHRIASGAEQLDEVALVVRPDLTVTLAWESDLRPVMLRTVRTDGESPLGVVQVLGRTETQVRVPAGSAAVELLDAGGRVLRRAAVEFRAGESRVELGR